MKEKLTDIKSIYTLGEITEEDLDSRLTSGRVAFKYDKIAYSFALEGEHIVFQRNLVATFKFDNSKDLLIYLRDNFIGLELDLSEHLTRYTVELPSLDEVSALLTEEVPYADEAETVLDVISIIADFLDKSGSIIED